MAASPFSYSTRSARGAAPRDSGKRPTTPVPPPDSAAAKRAARPRMRARARSPSPSRLSARPSAPLSAPVYRMHAARARKQRSAWLACSSGARSISSAACSARYSGWARQPISATKQAARRRRRRGAVSPGNRASVHGASSSPYAGARAARSAMPRQAASSGSSARVSGGSRASASPSRRPRAENVTRRGRARRSRRSIASAENGSRAARRRGAPPARSSDSALCVATSETRRASSRAGSV